MDTKLVLTIVVSSVDNSRLVHKLLRTTNQLLSLHCFPNRTSKTEEYIPKSQTIQPPPRHIFLLRVQHIRQRNLLSHLRLL
jgi:hypothetical protein